MSIKFLAEKYNGMILFFISCKKSIEEWRKLWYNDFSGDEIELTVTETYEYDSYGNNIRMDREYSNKNTYTDYFIEYEYILLSDHLNG